MAAVTIGKDFGAEKIKSVTVSIVSPSIGREVMGPDQAHGLFQQGAFAGKNSLVGVGRV